MIYIYLLLFSKYLCFSLTRLINFFLFTLSLSLSIYLSVHSNRGKQLYKEEEEDSFYFFPI